MVKKFQSVYFESNMRIKSILGLPAQTRPEVRIFKTILDDFISYEQIKTFEWGSGFSTVYYAEYLRKKGVEFEWHSIDNNKSWYEKIKSKLEKKGLLSYIQMCLKEFIPFWEKPGWRSIPPNCGVFGPKSENEKAYINFPKLLKHKFNIVIVDGRFRRHCIETAKDILLPEGVVILHDAHKEHYHTGLDEFQYRKFLNSGSWFPFQEIRNKVWIGSAGNSRIFDALKQF